MLQEFEPGDFLIFQLESGYGLLRVLSVEGGSEDPVWHVAVYRDLFLDPDMADAALQTPSSLAVDLPHVALTNRAFESTQVAKMANFPLEEFELQPLENWRRDPAAAVSDRSVRLMLGIR